MLQQSNILCRDLHQTYNAYLLNNYPKLKDIFVQVRDLYEKDPKKYPKANETLMSLVYNVVNREKIPIVDYITGPGEISKWESKKYNKIIYLFGENDHGNQTGCNLSNKNGQINLYGKKHMIVQEYLMKLFKHSPVFIDFYVEFGVMLDELEHVDNTSGQTLWDMLAVMKGCFGPLDNRDCKYNVRMHGVDSRSIKSKKHTVSNIAKMSVTIMMQNILSSRGRSYIPFKKFKEIFGKEIEKFSKVEDYQDLIKIILDDIKNNTLIMKELNRSTISSSKILDFFVTKELDNFLSKYPYGVATLVYWFELVNKKGAKDWPPISELDWTSYLMTPLTARIMDVYAIARIFKKFNVKDSEFYPNEPRNIIYYAGTGHTMPMAGFLHSLGFKRTEYSNDEILSCVSMEGIRQPLFS